MRPTLLSQRETRKAQRKHLKRVARKKGLDKKRGSKVQPKKSRTIHA